MEMDENCSLQRKHVKVKSTFFVGIVIRDLFHEKRVLCQPQNKKNSRGYFV
jgi:hypothetical protein